MGYKNIVQVISRTTGNKQYYLMCPRAVAESIELKKGEVIDWTIKSRNEIILRRKNKGGDKK